MKKQSSFAVIFILLIGAVLAGVIYRMDISGQRVHEDIVGENKGDARGPHGGWLFSENAFQIELKIYEKGVPPRFRAYVTDGSGNAIALSEVSLTVDLHRLDRIDTIRFQPSGDYLSGDMIVVEPHSFDVKINARWKDQPYHWEFSQIEARAELSEEAVQNAGVALETAGPAKLRSVIRLPGEIGLNEEKLVHIVPRLDGVVKKVFKDLGDQVSKGEVIALLESRELADAKILYLASTKQVDMAKADLERETLIFNNTKRMLDLLEQNLDLEKIYHELDGILIGESREQLIPAYARLQLANSVHLREKGLFDKGISSESEYLAAVEAYKSAEARYIALREKAAYDGEWSVREKTKNMELENLRLETATQKLFALGLAPQEVEALSQQGEHIFTQYELRSSLNGTVIQKHLATGEAVKKDDGILLLADLSDVWVNIAIPVKDIKDIHLGQKVFVNDDNRKTNVQGKLTYLGSLLDENTRTVNGRVVISNPDRSWRPGTYVTVELIVQERTVPLAVLSEAVQSIRDWSVVFVKYGNFFEARPLELGENDGHWVEVLSGLSKGEAYAAQNSFAVKAEIEKSSAVHDH